MATPLQTYQTSNDYKNAQTFQNQTMQDIAKRYGFDFSRGYADNQANTAAQAQINAQNAASRENQSMHNSNMNDINSGLKQGVIGTENNFFQTYLKQRQAQANRGLNAGIQADQNMRLGMNQQQVLSGMYQDANNNRAKENDRFSNDSMRIKDALAQIEKQRIADAEKMYQDLLARGYDVLSSDRNYGMQLDNSAWSKYMDSLNYGLSLKRSSGSPGGGQPSPSTTPLSNPAKNYVDTIEKQKATPIEKYMKSVTPVPFNQRYLYDTYKLAPKSVANNPNLSLYDKMKLMGG